MNNEDQTELINKYPKLFRQVGLPASESCMAWGIECGKGSIGASIYIFTTIVCRKLL